MPLLTTIPRRSADPELPAAVLQTLRQVPEAAFRERLHKVLVSGTRAIAKLRDIDLSQIEHLAASGEGSDLALWEQVAPAVGASIGDVNGLLQTIHAEFPAEAKAAAEDDLDMAFGPADEADSAPKGPPTSVEERSAAAVKGIQSICESLRYEVGRFGNRVRNPAIVADRWNLLVDLQEFRGKCRAAIGELIYSSCSSFSEVARPSVIPEYANDLSEALAVRHAWITLTRAVGPLNARLQIAGAEQQRGLLLAVQREVEHYRASRGYNQMRAGDKQHVIKFFEQLGDVLKNRRFGHEAKMLVEGFAKFLDSMAILNRRETLINHDHEAYAECGRLLEAASLHLGVGEPTRAMSKLTQALHTATRLYGRDRFLDDYLVLRLRWPLENLIDDALGLAVEELRKCVAESGTHAAGSIL